MTGTLLNVVTVVIGASVGTLLGRRFPEGMRSTVMGGLGLFTTFMGLEMGLQTQQMLVVLGSVVLGGIIGEAVNIEGRLSQVAERLERCLGFAQQKGRFAEGFIVASLVFCVGPMAIMGSLQDGLTGDFSTLAVKSALDGFASVAFAASLGIGVGFSALVIFLYQGAITLLAAWASPLLTGAMIREMTAVGGILIFGIGLGLLEIKKLRVANLLPAIFIVPFLLLLANKL